MKVCQHCEEEIKLSKSGNGYVHKNGGMYKQYCDKCGWSGDKEGSYGFCPKCLNPDVRDSHCVLPIDESKLEN